MDFNSILSAITPYLNLGTIATAIVVILTIVFKVKKGLNEIKGNYLSFDSEILKAIKKAIPESVYVNIETLAKSELSKITENINSVINEKVLNQIKSNTELVKEIAKALCSMKAIPDTCKTEIANLLEIKDVETTAGLKVELLPTEPAKENTDILID